MTIDNPAIAAAHVALEIAAGDRFASRIVVYPADFRGEANAPDALRDALEALSLRSATMDDHARVDIAARYDEHGVHVDFDSVEFRDADFVTAVVTLSTAFAQHLTNHGGAFTDIRRALEAKESESGAYVNRVIYLLEEIEK